MCVCVDMEINRDHCFACFGASEDEFFTFGEGFKHKNLPWCCHRSNCIYAIRCLHCEIFLGLQTLYVGFTTEFIQIRCGHHRNDPTGLREHFDLCHPSETQTEWIRIYVLEHKEDKLHGTNYEQKIRQELLQVAKDERLNLNLLSKKDN